MGVMSKPVHESVCHDWIGEDGMPVPSKIFICRDGAGRSEVEVFDIEMLPAGHASNGFGQVSLSRAGRTEEEDVFALLDEAAGG